MKRQTTIALFYTGVAVISAAIIGTAFYLRSQLPKPDVAGIVNAGKETTTDWFPIAKDLTATNQDGKTATLKASANGTFRFPTKPGQSYSFR